MAAAKDAWTGQRIPIRITTELDTITGVSAPKTPCTKCQGPGKALIGKVNFRCFYGMKAGGFYSEDDSLQNSISLVAQQSEQCPLSGSGK